MGNLILFLKGLVIGIGKILPGVSGSLLAISLNVYEESIEAISNIYKDIKKNSIYLFFLGLGISLSIIFFSKIILYLFINYYTFTMSFILGTLFGILPSMWKKSIPKDKIDLLVFIIPIILFINFNSLKIENISINYLTYFFLGIIEAITMILPGISGTSIYLLLGVYNQILLLFTNPFTITFLIFILGILIGILLLSKMLNYGFKKYHHKMDVLILSFTTSSIFLLLKEYINNQNSLSIITIIIFIFGFFLSFLFDK
jgi:putative membrane protein